MTEIQQTRWDRTVRRVANIVAPGSMVADALNELFPIFDVENLPGELFLLGGTQLCIGSASVAAGGGVFPRVQIRNPVDSGHIITVTSFVAAHNATPAVDMRWGLNATILTTGTGGETFREGRTRLSAAGRPVGQIFVDSLAIPGPLDGRTRVEINVPFIQDDPNSICVLPPGIGLEVSTNTAAHTLLVTFYWRERPAEPAELNL